MSQSWVLSNILRQAFRKNTIFHRRSQSKSFSSWDLVAACCLERKPTLTQTLSSFELQSKEYFENIENTRSFLSDHEMRHIEDGKRAERLKQGILDDVDMAAIQQTARDFEDQCIKEYEQFSPASRVTQSDDNDLKSTKRKLDSTLILVLKQKFGNASTWCLPQTVHQAGESLRETAERGLIDVCGSNLHVQFIGNAPVGFYKYKYPKIVRNGGICGAKVFFFKAELLHGNICSESLTKSTTVEDYSWLLQSELHSVFKPVYHQAVDAILWHDDALENVDESHKRIESTFTS